jgi:hypothetical protein
MACPFCSTTAPQKRNDGRCVACGKLLPGALRGTPDPLPVVAQHCSKLLPGDAVERHGPIRRGDIVVLLQLHPNRFAIKAVTADEAAAYPGPKYLAPTDVVELDVIFVIDGWEEYRPHKPWWKFW